MPTSAEPTAAYDIAVDLLACALAGIENSANSELRLDRSCVVWGQAALDRCECGELYVVIGRQTPSNGFPQEGSTTSQTTRCGPPIWMVNFSVIVARCVPGMDDQGNPPTCTALDASARIAAIDAFAVRNAVGCCLWSMLKTPQLNGAMAITDYLIREQVPYGPEGYCAGSVLNILVGLRNCWCAETGS